MSDFTYALSTIFVLVFLFALGFVCGHGTATQPAPACEEVMYE